MDRESHEAISIAMFGEPCSEVHQWIDACFADFMPIGKHSNYGSVYFHWIERHHMEAIGEKYKVGTIEYNAAKLHIITDWISHWGMVELPANRKETISLISFKLGIKVPV